jgi:hypothetical protein
MSDKGGREMTRFRAVLLLTMLLVSVPAVMSQTDARQALIERAQSLELNTPYVPAPGDA